MEFRILGPLEVLEDGKPIQVGPLKQRSLLALLLINANRVVATDRILEHLWGDDAAGKEKALWTYISRLRSALGTSESVVTRDHGYSLEVDPENVDAHRFETKAAAGRALVKDDPVAASKLLGDSLGLWRGQPLEEFAYAEFAQFEIARLEELRSKAHEDRIDADLRLGLAGELIGELEVLHRERPTSERVAGQLILALYRAGRQSDALRAFERFRVYLGEELGLEPSPELRLLEEQVLLHDSRIQPRQPVTRADPSQVAVNPFKGLRPFYEDDSADFFGRSAVVADVVERIDGDAGLIGLVGPSGSGKSSIVRAGVIPALRKGALPGSDEWLIAEMVPGAHPFAELEAALLRTSLDTPDSLSDQLADDAMGVLRAVLRVLPKENARLILVIDQFEELFTLVDDEELRVRFLSGLQSAVADPHRRVKVIFTLRADFYDRPLAYPDFGTLMGAGIVNVVPLSPDELEAAARWPAQEAGVSMEPALLAALITDVVGRPGGLPLFQYALTELFDRRIDATLTLATYTAMDGVRGALSRRADDLYTELDSGEQAAAKQLFLRLVTIADGDEWGRRRVPASEILALDIDVVALQTVIDSYAAHRLLTLDRDIVTDSPTVEVAHEALLTEWARLREWIDDAKEDLKRHDTLTAALHEWEDAGRDPDYLLSGARLTAYEQWAETSTMHLTRAQQDFIRKGRDRRDDDDDDRRAQEADEKRKGRRRFRAAAAVALLAGVVAAFLIANSPEDPIRVAAFGPHETGSAMRELASSGFARAERELSVEVEQLADGRVSDIEAEYRALGESGADLMILESLTVGAPWLAEVIDDYPETAFTVIEPFETAPDSVLSVYFANEQVGFLAGAAAALASETGVIGYIGALQIPELEAWRAGYETGALAVNPEIEILASYPTSDISEGFESVDTGRAEALDLYRMGADVVLHAAGAASIGAIEAARAHTRDTGTHVWAIAPDSDWSLEIGSDLQPFLLTSAIKKIDLVVFDVIERVTSGEFEPGVETLTLASGSIALAPTQHLSQDQLTTIDDLTSQVSANAITVPTMPVGELLPRLAVREFTVAPGAEVDDIEIGDGFGAYDVGVQTVSLVDPSGAGRELTVEVWFPIDDAAGLAPWRNEVPGVALESSHAFVATAQQISQEGPFPLVVYSHGEGAPRIFDSNFNEAMASHGYIVAAPDHLGDGCCEPRDPLARILLNRPHDVTAVIDGMLHVEGVESGVFASSIDPDRIAVTGHQGFTAYATVAGYDNDLGEYVADERVDAIIATAPSVNFLSDERLGSIDIPTLIIIGTDDQGGGSATRPWELAGGSPSYRVDLVGGEHISFTDICTYVRLLEDAPDADEDFRGLMNFFAPQGCEPDDFPFERAQAITNTFATTFLESVFRGADPIRLDQVDGQEDLIYQIK